MLFMLQEIWILLAMVYISNGFLTKQLCIVGPPCRCSVYGDMVNCENKNLQKIPPFAIVNEQWDEMSLQMNKNHIKTIPANAFSSLWTKVSNINIYLSDNQIDRIENNAFDGITTNIRHLFLSNNNLTYLPKALSKLWGLQSLFIEGNPLTKLDSDVMSNLGMDLALSLGHFASFPNEIKFLSNTASLYMSDIPFSTIPVNEFYRLNDSLDALVIYRSQLQDFPKAFCSLMYLRILKVTYSPLLFKINIDIPDVCFANLTRLDQLSLNFDNLTVFPSVIKLFPNLKKLSLENNNIEIIDDNNVGRNMSVTTLFLSNNSFIKIPKAINRFSRLTYLDMSYNMISSISNDDLHGLAKLQTLRLDHNPISHISHDAFLHNSNLGELDLHFANLRIPESVLGLRYLRSITLVGNNITCSCSDMAYLMSYNIDK